MFQKILVANRGEIAVRIVRACREMGIQTVLAHSEVDRNSLAAALADETVCVGPASSERSYLHVPNIVSAALLSAADAIHPGYGFLSENASFAEVCAEVGLVFIGPPPSVLDAFGDKVQARRLMREAGLPVIPGTDEPLLSRDAARDAAATIGYPLMLKAAAGGGGRGMRIARDPSELARQFSAAQLEAQNAFGNGALYLESLLEGARHVEIQIAADNAGDIVHLGERDCSVQRRHQKLIEERPAPGISAATRQALGEAAVRGAAAVGYRGMGTMEFLLDRRGRFWFLETNCRIQVEHPVTEMVTALDLVKTQIRLAAGESLPWSQAQIRFSGHAIECRITAEDPNRDFAPAAGVVETLLLPGGPGVRVDTHVFPGYEFPPHYDSLLAKLIVWGADRAEALARLGRALRETRIGGLATNIPYLQEVLADPRFQVGGVGIDYRPASWLARTSESVSAGTAAS